MKVIEATPDQERLRLLNSVANDGAKYLGCDSEHDSPKDIMAKVNEAIVALVLGNETPVSEDENPDLLLGCLWGVQMIRQFNWYWADVKIDDKYDEVAIISPNKEMIIFPLAFASACINKQCICTVLLSFNMLLEGNQFNSLKPGSYENIMLGIHHIVPPYVLE